MTHKRNRKKPAADAAPAFTIADWFRWRLTQIPRDPNPQTFEEYLRGTRLAK